ncbi:MAG: ATP-binding protein [Terriglobales bacterium]|jgi:hypothetical protein
MFPGSYQNLRLMALDPYDFTLSKLERNSQKDRDDTVEAIRQALLADEARITYSNPVLPSQRILEMRVNSSLVGRDFELVFNDGFNSIIGGRGAGKSALLEYLRFGLGRSTQDITSDADSELQRYRDLIDRTLSEGCIAFRFAVLSDRGAFRLDELFGSIPEPRVREACVPKL